ncbi:DUF6530 family protein [Paenibacillus guangzhouensis]|uniref:DUF6530 family protein n=1 Tax=Paenibacillus guangzhouensis TaxID=1473112 RepID=UPI0012669E3A|nr:DUF6530 family protein [Paenibacillus guangzhouensis]
MNSPEMKNHKPVIIADDYGKVDGRFAFSSDVQRLSLGLSTLPGADQSMISASICRNSEGQPSSNMEEIPLHRILDLSILVCSALTHFSEAYRYEHLYDPENPIIDRIGLQGNAMNVSVCTDNKEIRKDIQLFDKSLSDNGEMIGERLRALSRLLLEMGYD